jgi:hypothetical protein
MAESKAKTNSTKTLTNAELGLEVKRLRGEIEKEDKVKVSIPKAFAPQLGNSLFVGVNGSKVIIPVDGKEYAIPKTLAAHVKEYINSL